MRYILPRFLRRLLLRDEGNATIEFVIVFPLFIALFLAAFELGMLQLRHTMLERGLDIAVRMVRISAGSTPDYATIRDTVCENAPLIPNCTDNLKLEMIRLDPWTSFSALPATDCIDRSVPFAPVRSWVEDGPNDLLLLRACVLFDPMFPTTGIGYKLSEGFANGGAYALTARNAFVVEPE